MNPERLNKVLSHLGFGSRRAIDTLISDGHVRVNGKVATLGTKVFPSDVLELDGRVINRTEPKTIVLAFNKPKGVTTTKQDPFAKVTVMDYLPHKYQHLHPIGRLDRDSRGLLLFTNNGKITLRLEHPRYAHEKEYCILATPLKAVTTASFKRDMQRLATKVINPQAQSHPVTVLQQHFDPTKKQASITVILREGKKRQIRRVLQTLGYFVTDLQRVRILTVRLDGLKEGEYREVDENALNI